MIGILPVAAKPSSGKALFGFLTALLLAACGSGEPVPFQPGPAPWTSSEASMYRVTDRDGNYAGTARFDITASVWPESAGGWAIRREIAAGGQSEISVIDVTDGDYRPKHSEMVRTNQANQQERIEAVVVGGQVDITLISVQDVMSVQRVNVPSDIRDERTLPMVLRTLPLAKGYVTRLNSFLPIVGKLNRVNVEVVGEETIALPLVTYATWKVELKSDDGRTTQAWIGTLAPYPLVKFVDGRSRATYALSEFEPGPAARVQNGAHPKPRSLFLWRRCGRTPVGLPQCGQTIS